MKFRLVESVDNLIQEEIDGTNELYHLFSDIAGNSYRPSGYMSRLSKRELNALFEYCRKHRLNYNAILQNYEGHHINGVHPKNKTHQYGGYDNVALINKSTNIHNKYTDFNKDIIIDSVKRLGQDPNDTISSLAIRLYCKCVIKGEPPNNYLNSTFTTKLNRIVDIIINKCREHFYRTYKMYGNDVILMSDVMSGK